MTKQYSPRPFTAVGDMDYAGSNVNPTRLAAGLDGDSLRYRSYGGSVVPEWLSEPRIVVKWSATPVQADIEEAIARAQARNFDFVVLPPTYVTCDNLQVPVGIRLVSQNYKPGLNLTGARMLLRGSAGVSTPVVVLAHSAGLEGIHVYGSSTPVNGRTIISITSHYARVQWCQIGVGDGETGIKGGALIGIEILRNNINHFKGIGMDFLNSYGSGGYYGLDNNSFISWNSFSGSGIAIRVDGAVLLEGNDIEGNLDGSALLSTEAKVVIGGSSPTISSHIRALYNYFEFTGPPLNGAVNKCFSVIGQADTRFIGNNLNPNISTAGKSITIDLSGYACYGTIIEQNNFGTTDIGIKFGSIANNAQVEIGQNQWATNGVVNTAISGMPTTHFFSSGEAKSFIYRVDSGGLRYINTGLIPTMQRVFDVTGDYKQTFYPDRGNVMELDKASAGNVILSGGTDNPGQPIWTYCKTKGMGLAAADWGIGTDYIPEVNDINLWLIDGNGQLRPARSYLPKPKVVTTTYTVLEDNEYILADASGGAFTINLPTSVGKNGWRVNVKKTDTSANAVTIDANSTQTIDGALTVKLYNQYESLRIASDNANWFVDFRSDLYGSATWNPPDLVTAAQQTTTVTVTGAVLGDRVTGISFSLDQAGTVFTGYVSAADTVTVTQRNDTGGNVNLGSGTIRAWVGRS